jgi:hypothetical protein
MKKPSTPWAGLRAALAAAWSPRRCAELAGRSPFR